MLPTHTVTTASEVNPISSQAPLVAQPLFPVPTVSVVPPVAPVMTSLVPVVVSQPVQPVSVQAPIVSLPPPAVTLAVVNNAVPVIKVVADGAEGGGGGAEN